LEAALRLIKINPEEAQILLIDLQQLGRQALSEVRQSVSILRADPLNGKSLLESINSLISSFFSSTKILPHLDYSLLQSFPDVYNSTIYRIIQESLTNCSKHSKATYLSIIVKEDNDKVVIIVSDNGIGFDLDRVPLGFGLKGMKERVAVLSGIVEISTAANQGCHIQVFLPF